MIASMLTTASTPGGVAMIQLHGDNVTQVLTKLTTKKTWPLGVLKLVEFADIDQGLAVVLENNWAQLMPHGGLRVVQRLLEFLHQQCDVTPSDQLDTQLLYPEAPSALHADMLHYLAKAASPAAIDFLLQQPDAWQNYLHPINLGQNDLQPNKMRQNNGPPIKIDHTKKKAIQSQTAQLDQLVNPPTVVICGCPNVGKSTLTNRLLGRTASLVADLPGTTRDWVASLAELDNVAVRWLDTPGIRKSDDPIEQQAIVLARRAIMQADVLIAMRDPYTPWPSLPREPDLRVCNKADLGQIAEPNVLHLTALTGQGMDLLEQHILSQLGLKQLTSDLPWAFSEKLKQLVTSQNSTLLEAYCGV